MRARLGIVAVAVGGVLVAGCSSSGSKPSTAAGVTPGPGTSASTYPGVDPTTWANSVCGSFSDYGQAQIDARNQLGNAVSGATTALAQQKLTTAATSLDGVATKIAAVQAALKKEGTPGVPNGADVIASLDAALSTQATAMTTVAAQTRALKGSGSALAAEVQKVIDTFSEDNQKVSDQVATSFENTNGGKELETAFAASTCAKSLQSSSPS